MGVTALAGSHHRSPTCRISKHQEPTSWPSSLMHGVGVRGSEKGEREAHCLRQCGWPASSLLAHPRRPDRPSWELRMCRIRQGACDKHKFLENSLHARWKVGCETVALRVPKIPHPFCPGSWDIPGSQVSPSSSRQHQHRHSPRNSHSPSHLTLPLGPDTWALLSGNSKAPETQMHIQS